MNRDHRNGVSASHFIKDSNQHLEGGSGEYDRLVFRRSDDPEAEGDFKRSRDDKIRLVSSACLASDGVGKIWVRRASGTVFTSPHYRI